MSFKALCTKFNIKKLYKLPTQCICVSYGSKSRHKWFPLQHFPAATYNRDAELITWYELKLLNIISFRLQKAVPWVKGLVAVILTQKLGFYPGSLDMRFVANNKALGQVLLTVLRFSRQYHSTNT